MVSRSQLFLFNEEGEEMKSFDQRESESVRLQIENLDSVCKTRMRVASKSSFEDDFDLDKELEMEGSLDDKECMWLSSDCGSPSSFFAEHRLSGSEETFQEGSKSSPGNDTIDPSETSSDKSLSQISDMEKTSFCVSLMNLDGEDFNLISDTESELDDFESGFPSPSYRSSCNSEVKLSDSSASVPTLARDEKLNYDHLSSEDLEDLNVNEPLFWPSELGGDWSSEETWKSFTMSPRKDIREVIRSNPEGTLQGKIHSKVRSRRRFLTNSGSTASKILELKQRNNNNKHVKKLNKTPSRLQNSNKSSAKVVPLETEDKMTETKNMDRILFQEDFSSNNELQIEKVLGLGEFDGHEGVDSDINVDVFFLEEYL